MARPMVWAFSFAAVDLLWVLVLHVLAGGGTKESPSLPHTEGSIAISATKLWNAIHWPIRQLIEPFLFPLVTSHPLSPDAMVFVAYEVLCVFQSALMGYVVCVLVRWVMNRRALMENNK